MAIFHVLVMAALLFQVISAAVTIGVEKDLEEFESNCSTALLQTSAKASRVLDPPEYYWVQRGSKPTNFGYTKYTAPSNFSQKNPAWIWQNENDEQVRHSPLIDDKMNLYVMTTLKLRKFSPDGKILWTWHPEEGKMTASPALYQGGVYLLSAGASQSGGSPLPEFVTVHVVEMETGQLRWKKVIPGAAGGDSQSVFVYNDTCIVPMETGPDRAGTNKFAAVSALNGSSLWEYSMDEVVWNAAITTPGDGTLLFAGSCGGAFRISFGGELIWRSGPEPEPNKMCSTGGGTLGPNGVYYTEYNKAANKTSHVSAYRVSDGVLLWEKTFPNFGGGQYPAVGPLGKDGPLVVAVAIGDNPMNPLVMKPDIYKTRESAEAYFKDPEARKKMGVPNYVNAVVVMDASTGNEIWRWEAPKWDHFAAAGDEEPSMLHRLVTNSPENPICLPDLQGIPLISGDGTIYSSSSHSGDLTAIRDDNHNGIIESTEISVFSPHRCFLNSPSLAPGLLVAAPCWGPMYVFKE